MKLPQPERPRGRDLDMLPVINLVFLLLVFVILTGGAASAEKPDEPRAQRLVVERDGQLRLNGETVDAAKLAEKFKPPPALLRIEADGALPATTLAALLEDLQRAGITNAELRRRP